jgi:hypothetical protein
VAKRTASAKKQARASVRRTLRNRAIRSEVKTKIVKARRSLTGSPVARRKARLTRQLVKLGGVAAAPVAAGGRSKKGATAGKEAAKAVVAAKAPDKKAAAKKPGSK